MGLMDILNQCITAGHEMTKAIAIARSLMTTVRKQEDHPPLENW